MNIEQYISTGILEAYALGELKDLERAEVEKILAQYRELRDELRRIEDTQEELLTQLAMVPPSYVKTSVIQALKPETKVVALTASNVFRWKFAAAASVVLALFLGYLAYDYRDKWIHSQVALNELIAQSQQVAHDYNRVNLRLDKMESDLKIMNDPSFVKVVMSGTANAPQAMASVYWNRETKEVYLSIQSMRELAQEKQYQLWAQIDDKMVDAGVFDGNISGLIKMKSMNSRVITVFAVTIEPRGGKPEPTVETLQVAGSLSKG